MSLKDDLTNEVKGVFSTNWDVTKGRVVPNPSDVGLGNKAVYLEQAVVLYADLDGSTNMVDSKKWEYSAQVYKSFLHCAAKVIRSEGGDITAYDGDRIMAIFINDGKADRAVRAALKIHWCLIELVNKIKLEKWNASDHVIKNIVGIDVSDLRAVRTGVRGDNDLVWVGRAANYAAKLTSLSGSPTWITKEVHDLLSRSTLYGKNDAAMWQAKTWTSMNNHSIFCSDFWWSVS